MIRPRKRTRSNLDVKDSVKLPHQLPPSSVTFSPCGKYLAIASRRVEIFASSSIGRAATPIASFEPPSSTNMITALAISHSLTLCLAHRDGAFLYDNALDENSNEHTILDSTGLKSQCVFNPNGTLVAMPVNSVVYVVDVKTRKSIFQLEGHGAIVTSLAFNPHRPQQLATTSEDRSFKLWDVENRCLLYQSAIISMSPFTTLAFDPQRERLAVGSEDGKLRFYTLTLPSRGTETIHVREERTVDVGILLRKREKILKNNKKEHLQQLRNNGGDEDDPDAAPHVISSLPAWARGNGITNLNSNENNQDNNEDDNELNEDDDDDDDDYVDTTMLSLHFRTPFLSPKASKKEATRQRRNEGLGWHGTGILNESDEDNEEENGVGGVLWDNEVDANDGNGATGKYWKENTTWMIVGTPNALIHIDTSSYEIDTVLSFRDAEESLTSTTTSSWRNGYGSNRPPAAPSSPTTLLLPNDRGILSPLSAQAMAMGTARQKQAVPLEMTAACFAFASHQQLSPQSNEANPKKNEDEKNKKIPRRASRIEYYKKRFIGEDSSSIASSSTSTTSSASSMLDGLLCVVGSAFVPGATVLKLPKEPIDLTTPTPRPKIEMNFKNQPKTTTNKFINNINTAVTTAAAAATTTATTHPPQIISASAVVVAAPPPPTLSLFPTRPLSKDSSLRNSDFKTKTNTTPGKKLMSLKKKNRKTMNQPVTFHRNIRSSGYGSKAPVMSLHGKKKKRPSKYRNSHNTNSNTNTNNTTSNNVTGSSHLSNELYPMNCSIPTRHQIAHQIAMDGPHCKESLHGGPVLKIQYTRDASYIASCSADRTCTSMRLPCSRYTDEKHRSVHLGHDGPVHSIDWSHNSQSQLLLTASTDGTARMWERGRSDAVLTFDRWQKSSTKEQKNKMKNGIGNAHSLGGGLVGSQSSNALLKRNHHHTRTSGMMPSASINHLNSNTNSGSNSGNSSNSSNSGNNSSSNSPSSMLKSNATNPLYGSTSVTQASFAYMDTFVLLSVGNSLCLHKYAVDRLDGAKDDLRRLQNKSRYRLVSKYTHANCQTVTSFAHANSFYSTLVITGGSNRCVNIYDMGVSGNGKGNGKGNVPVICIPDAHSRSVTSVKLPSFSEYVNVPNAAYDVFLTSGSEGCIKLWDVRDPMRPMRTFACHSRSTAMAMDPTMRYLACVSRDAPNVLSMYDLRTGELLDGIQCGSDGVIDVAFSPRHPQMCVGSADGRLRFFTV